MVPDRNPKSSEASRGFVASDFTKAREPEVLTTILTAKMKCLEPSQAFGNSWNLPRLFKKFRIEKFENHKGDLLPKTTAYAEL